MFLFDQCRWGWNESTHCAKARIDAQVGFSFVATFYRLPLRQPSSFSYSTHKLGSLINRPAVILLLILLLVVAS